MTLLITHAFMDSPYIENDLYKAILFDKLSINEGMFIENKDVMVKDGIVHLPIYMTLFL